ncbi:MAG: TetR/AcrR family transcriptional regulator [Holophagaceae bacterium]|nr:TetR/AcrR family transcriptional regulator [Holophagaceae bacterium]
MHERIRALRKLEPVNSGRTSYLAILEAAAGLFSQFPAEDITLRDILAISGVSNQTLYNYFPNGRDDIAIMLFDRYQRTLVEDFNGRSQSIEWDAAASDAAIIAQISACLARSVFGFLRTTQSLQIAVHGYLRGHNLLCLASHFEELEAALLQVLSQPLRQRFAVAELPRVVRLSVHSVRGIADHALTDATFSLDHLESCARKVCRALLRTGLRDLDRPSESHGIQAYPTGSTAILGAPLSPIKRQGILDRILKRKRPGSA